jgi:hypothetical protein
VFKAFNGVRGKAMHLATMEGEVFLTVISTEGDIKVFEIGVLLTKFDTIPEDQDVLDLGSEFEDIYKITISSRL